MSKNAHFKIDPKLATLLGENYRSTELALKELIDNAYDADSENVRVQLPELFSGAPIVIQDDGTGMTEKEIREEYLRVANSRFSRKGERTRGKKRIVKGRKGIGKFSGLLIAEVMQIESIARGTKTTLTISKSALMRADYDLSNINLPIETEKIDTEATGTTITLAGINDNLPFPNPVRLKQLMITEYGKIEDFNIVVNNLPVDVEDIDGTTFEETASLPLSGTIHIKYTISNQKKSLKQAGLTIKVKNRIIGRPQLMGLEKSSDIPEKLLKRIMGVVTADKLEEDVTGDWGAIIESSEMYQEIKNYIRPKLEESFKVTYDTEVKTASAKLKRRVSKGLLKLPEHKRALAKKSLEQVMLRFFGEPEEKIATVISVVLGAFEKDDYHFTVSQIEKSKTKSTPTHIKSFVNFGTVDNAIMARQAQSRLTFIEEFEALINKGDADAEQVNNALQNNLWLLGIDFHLSSSDNTLKKVVNDYLDRKYAARSGRKKPGIFLLQDYKKNFTLVEVKKPGYPIRRADESKVLGHRDDLMLLFPNNKIDILLIGERIKEKTEFNLGENSKFMSFDDLISNAKGQVRWLTNKLIYQNS